jgi:hypothetical protein
VLYHFHPAVDRVYASVAVGRSALTPCEPPSCPVELARIANAVIAATVISRRIRKSTGRVNSGFGNSGFGNRAMAAPPNTASLARQARQHGKPDECGNSMREFLFRFGIVINRGPENLRALSISGTAQHDWLTRNRASSQPIA